MARREFIEGTWSRKYEYVEICRDDYSCRKKFKWREEEDLADAYYNHLQSLDDQANTFREQKRAADEQKRAADELEALRKATEEKIEETENDLFAPRFHSLQDKFLIQNIKNGWSLKKQPIQNS